MERRTNMRGLLIGVAVFFLLVSGAAALVWINRVPLAEWAIDTYQPETPLGPVSVRIADISLSSVSIAEIRARYRGPIAIQDVTAVFEIGADWHLTLPSVRIGSLNAALSFADWFDLLDTLTARGSEAGGPGLPTFPLSVGELTVETIDLYAETPKGYALLNGNLGFEKPVDFSQPTALTRLADGLDGTLLLSHLFRLEDMRSAIDQVLESCGIDRRVGAALPRVNPRAPGSAFAPSPAQRARIQSLYAEDCDLYETS